MQHSAVVEVEAMDLSQMASSSMSNTYKVFHHLHMLCGCACGCGRCIHLNAATKAHFG